VRRVVGRLAGRVARLMERRRHGLHPARRCPRPGCRTKVDVPPPATLPPAQLESTSTPSPARFPHPRSNSRLTELPVPDLASATLCVAATIMFLTAHHWGGYIAGFLFLPGAFRALGAFVTGRDFNIPSHPLSRTLSGFFVLYSIAFIAFVWRFFGRWRLRGRVRCRDRHLQPAGLRTSRQTQRVGIPPTWRGRTWPCYTHPCPLGPPLSSPVRQRPG